MFLRSAKKTYFFWGVMDILYLICFVVNSILSGRIPYVSDMVDASSASEAYGNILPYVSVVVQISLQLSLVGTAALFFLGSSLSRKVYYFQIPFRLYFLIPSFTFLVFVTPLFEGNEWVYLGIILVFEILKVVSLRSRNALRNL